MSAFDDFYQEVCKFIESFEKRDSSRLVIFSAWVKDKIRNLDDGFDQENRALHDATQGLVAAFTMVGLITKFACALKIDSEGSELVYQLSLDLLRANLGTMRRVLGK